MSFLTMIYLIVGANDNIGFSGIANEEWGINTTVNPKSPL